MGQQQQSAGHCRPKARHAGIPQELGDTQSLREGANWRHRCGGFGFLDTFALFEAIQFVIVYYGSPSKPAQGASLHTLRALKGDSAHSGRK